MAIKPNNGSIANVSFYVDGSIAGVDTGTGNVFNIAESTNFSIGADRTGAGRVKFIGTLDDFRLYGKELNATAISALYASGAGEGYYTPTLPVITVDEFANSSPVPVSVTFKRGGSNFAVAGFTASDVTVSGGTVSNFTGSGGGGHTYNFSITPTTFPSTVTITIPQGAASGGGGIYGNDITSKSFQASYSVSLDAGSVDGLEMWYDGSDLDANGVTDSNYSAGNAVNTWSDKSGNGYDMLNRRSDPAWAQHNGLGVVNLDGNDALYTNKYWGGGGEFTMFSVARYTHSTNNGRVISDATTNNWFMGFHSNNMHKWHFGGYLTEVFNGKDTKFHIHTANMNTNDQGLSLIHI